MSGVYRAVEMGSYDHVMAEIKGLMQGEYESLTTYGNRAWRLLLQLDEAEEGWVVANFIAGVNRCEFRLKLQAEYGNQAMSLDAAIRRLEVLECEKAKVANPDIDSDSGGFFKRGLVPADRSLSYYRAWRKAVDLVQKERESVAEYFVRACEILHCLDLVDERWLVNAFLNGLINDSFQGALNKARKANKSMTLLQAYEQLEIMASPVNSTNIDSNCSAGTGRVIAVEDILGHILVDPVAFRKFLAINNLQPYYQESGRYSKESIQILHHEFSQLTEEEAADVAPLMKASAEMALWGRKVCQDNCFEIPAINSAFSSTLVDDHTSEHLGGVKTNMGSNPNKAETKPMAIASGASSDSLKACDKKLEVYGIADRCIESYQNATGANEVEKSWEKNCFPNGGNRGENDRMGDLGGGENRGNRKSNEWIEGDVVNEQDVSMMDLGADTDSCAPDLIDPRWNLEAVEAAGDKDEEGLIAFVTSGEKDRCTEVDKHGTTEKLDNSYRPHISHAITVDAISNPSFRPVRTASEWDPGAGAPVEAIPAIDKDKDRHLLTSSDIQVMVPVVQNPMGIVVKTTLRDPTKLVVEYRWPPEFGTQQGYNHFPIPIQNTRTGQHRLLPRGPTTGATGVGSISCRNSSLSGHHRKFIQGEAATGTGNSAQSNPIYALYYIGKTGLALSGGPSGRQVWDPGGGREESLTLAGRCGKRRGKGAGENALEGNELGELAGGKHLGFEVPVEPQDRSGDLLVESVVCLCGQCALGEVM